MANFSISDAATAGFTVVRRHPAVLVVWAGVGLVTIILTTAAIFLVGGEHLQALAAAMQSGEVIGPEQAYALYRPLLPAYGASICIAMVAYSILMPAIYRSVLQPQSKSPGYLKLGAAELRQFGVNLAIVLLVSGVYGGLSYGLRLVTGSNPAPALQALGSLAILAVVVFLLVRTSLAGPDTLTRARLSLAGSWKLSKGVFWPIFATYALVVLFQIMISAGLLVILVILIGASLAASGLGAVGSAIGLVFTVLYLVAVSLIYAFGAAVMTAPAARIYQDLAGDGAP
jgi:hypothetical protein